jgi:hypothetical protein
MKRSSIFLTVILALLFVRTVSAAIPSLFGVLETNELTTAQSHGSTNLALLKASITAEDYAFFGFHSPHEVPQATNAEPLLIYTIPLNQLQNYHPGDDFKGLLNRSSRVIIPIMVRGQVRSSVAFRIDAAQDLVSDVRFGQGRLIRDLMTTHASIHPGQVKSGTAPFVVEIPVFDIWLIGYVNPQGRAVLLATIELPLGAMTIAAGQPITDVAMFQMTVKAQNYNGLPN